MERGRYAHQVIRGPLALPFSRVSVVSKDDPAEYISMLSSTCSVLKLLSYSFSMVEYHIVPLVIFLKLNFRGKKKTQNGIFHRRWLPALGTQREPEISGNQLSPHNVTVMTWNIF